MTRIYRRWMPSIMALGLLTGGACAELFLHEDFTYLDGRLEDVTGGNWTLALGVNSNMNIKNQAFFYDRTFDPDPPVTSRYERTLPHTIPKSNTAYMAFDLRLPSQPFTTSGTPFIHLLSDQVSTQRRCRIFLGHNGRSPTYQVGIRNSLRFSNADFFHPRILEVGKTYRIVARFEDGMPTPTNSVSTLWVNPIQETDTSVAEQSSNLFDDINKIAFRERTDRNLGDVFVDNLRICSAFLEVVAPEINFADFGPVIQWTSVSGTTYVVQSTLNATPTNWQMEARMTAAESSTFWGATNGVGANRSYRVVEE